MPVICDVCGGKGMATVRDAADLWRGATVRHTDPSICADNLRRERDRLEKLKKEIETKESNL